MRCRPTKARPAWGWCRSATELMYLYVTTPEPGNPRYPREGLAAGDARQADASARQRIAALAR